MAIGEGQQVPQGLHLHSRPRSLGATGNIKQENRIIRLCFGKSLLEAALIPWEGKRAEGRAPFQTVPCPQGKRRTGHQSFLREQTLSFGNHSQARIMLENKAIFSSRKACMLPSPGKTFYPSGRQSQVVPSLIKNQYLLCTNQNRHSGGRKGTGKNKMSKKRQGPPSLAALQSTWVGG